jgi:hypothetical protein
MPLSPSQLAGAAGKKMSVNATIGNPAGKNSAGSINQTN